ncbi:MAG TPA: zinc ribbon domain-containing protein [Bacteroidales bacterium]
MYCKNCGKIIEEDSKYCVYCGTNQKQIELTSFGSLKKENQNTIISFFNQNKIEELFGIKISNKLFGFYVAWLTLNFIAMLITWNKGTNKFFWPIESRSDFEDYDFTEFLFFTLTPILILFTRSFFINKKSFYSNVKKSDANNVLNFNQKKTIVRNKTAITQGIILLFISIILNVSFYNNYYPILFLLILTIKIIVTIRVTKIAGDLNRNKIGWGIFGFFFPPLALIIVGFQSKL